VLLYSFLPSRRPGLRRGTTNTLLGVPSTDPAEARRKFGQSQLINITSRLVVMARRSPWPGLLKQGGSRISTLVWREPPQWELGRELITRNTRGHVRPIYDIMSRGPQHQARFAGTVASC
jgi:hypothetical protein